jgi:hypothetical protein
MSCATPTNVSTAQRLGPWISDRSTGLVLMTVSLVGSTGCSWLAPLVGLLDRWLWLGLDRSASAVGGDGGFASTRSLYLNVMAVSAG